MKNRIVWALLVCIVLNCVASIGGLQIGSRSHVISSAASSPLYAVLSQSDQLIGVVKDIVSENLRLFPQYRPCKKANTPNDLSAIAVVPLFPSLQKPCSDSSTVAATLASNRFGQFASYPLGSRSSQAPPGGGFIFLFLLCYIISLHRSNLPAAAILLVGRLRPITTMVIGFFYFPERSRRVVV